jgi:tetratricopeptide (TPR) repeat protein
MDLLEFNEHSLYFDPPLPARVEALLNEAAEAYASGAAELPLLRAYVLAPGNLTVLVALYRYFYYQQRLDEALKVAEQARIAAGSALGFPADWSRLDLRYLSNAVRQSMGLVRFCLLALKAEGFLLLRMGELEQGRSRLQKVRELDDADRLGAGALLAVCDMAPLAAAV